MKNLSIRFRMLPYYWSRNYWKYSFKNVVLSFLSIFGSVWLFIETANHFKLAFAMPQTTPLTFSFILLSALFVSIFFNFPKLIHEVEIANTDVKIELIVANYFNLKGDKVVSTNSTFDTTLVDNFISLDSIQGQFFKKYYKKISHLDNDLLEALVTEIPKLVLNRTKSKNNQYNIGTVAKLNHIDFYSYWVALSDVNEFGKPISSFENLQVTLVELWEFIATKGRMENIVIPILGSGRTCINEKRERILQEIVFSFVAFASEYKITEKITIAIHPNDLLKHKINFLELCGFIDYTCKYKSSKNNGRSLEI